MARKPAQPPAVARFAALLAEHLAKGTRPATASGEPWTYAELAGEVPSSRGTESVSPRSVSNWSTGKSLPAEIEPLLRALFGPGAGGRHAEARETLRAAFDAARAASRDAIIRGAARELPRIVERDDQLVQDNGPSPTDREAAADPIQRQMHAAIRQMAAELADSAARLSNTRTWARLSAVAGKLRDLFNGDPSDFPDRLGSAYAVMLRLGGYIEEHDRLAQDRSASEDPLDADIHVILAPRCARPRRICAATRRSRRWMMTPANCCCV